MKRFYKIVFALTICALPSFFTANAQTIFTKAGNGNPGDYSLATSAYLNGPTQVAFDASGNMYIADATNNRIRKVSAATGIITTVAGNGKAAFSGDGGPATAASLSDPTGIACDKSGNLYIADSYNARIRKVDAATSIITTIAGTGNPDYTGTDGILATAASLSVFNIALDANGNIFVTDTRNQRIWKITAATGIITAVAGNGNSGFSGDGGPATAASLHIPLGVALDLNGNIFIADAGNNRIRKVDAFTGVITTVAGTTIAGFNGDWGPATSAKLNFPFSVAVDANGNLYISDKENYRIRQVNAVSGIITTIAGNGVHTSSGDGGQAISASFEFLMGLMLDASGSSYVIDAGAIRKITAATNVITTVAGNPTAQGSDGVQATDAWFSYPGSVAFDGNSNIYIADGRRVRKINAMGKITTIAGNGNSGFSGDGQQATAASFETWDAASDKNGNLYIADGINNRIRKVDPATGIITTIAGNGDNGFSGDGAAATDASLNRPNSVALDQNGNIFIGDYGNYRIRRVDAVTGIISTVAGNGSFVSSGEGGPATAASFANVSDLTIDAYGNLYFADGYDNRVRKVTAATGIISTVAGNGGYGFAGDGGQATAASLNSPRDIVLDANGNIYIADAANNRIRRVDAATGIISTIAGVGISDFAGDGGPATEASLKFPWKLAIDASSKLYVADADNHRIRYVCAAASPTSSSSQEVRTIYPEQTTAFFESNCTVQAKVQPSGAHPVMGTIADSVWIEPSVPVVNGQPYVQRHYGITPSQNASTATATITLYFTQAEFTAYNATPNHGPDLPVDATDAANNKANVRIIKRSGTSNNGTGLFDTYSGTTVGIAPTSVRWDKNLTAWAVTVDIEGFSGFFVTSSLVALPVKLLDFNVRLQNADASLTWHTASEESLSVYEVERSADAKTFAGVGRVNALGHASSYQYSYTDWNISQSGLLVVYYRLKMVNNDGTFSYSKVIPVNIGSRQAVITLYPNPVKETAMLSLAASKAESIHCLIVDAFGRTVVEKSFGVSQGLNTIPVDTKSLSPGTYTLLIRGSSTTKELRFVKQ